MKLMLKQTFTAALLASFLASGLASAGRRTTLQKLLELPAAAGDNPETKEQRQDRLREAAEAIDSATGTRWKRDWLIAVGSYESNFSSKVEDCSVKGDSGKAIGYWQSWVFKDREDCPKVGEAAAEAIRHLESAARYCRAKTPAESVFRGTALYATGKKCFWSGTVKRFKLWKKLGGQ